MSNASSRRIYWFQGALAALALLSWAAVQAEGNDSFFTGSAVSESDRAASVRESEDKTTRARIANTPKTPAVKTITNFSSALRCMDELFLANGKQGIVITSAGIPDATGKARAGDKEMMISAISKMTMKSGAFEFIDLTAGQGGEGDLAVLFDLKGGKATKIPDYYIRGAVTALDDNAVRQTKGAGLALPFLDLGYSKDEAYDVISMDLSVGDAATRRILPETNTSNTMVITKSGRSGEAGGKVIKLGLSFNKDLSRSEGVGATYRTLIELGLIEALGKFTRVPYWRCLDIESNNPELMDQVREWYDATPDKERLLFVQRKLAGMRRYTGPLDGLMSPALKDAVAQYQAAAGLIADGKLSFDVYFSLKDDIQNELAALPPEPPAPPKAPVSTQPLAVPKPAVAAVPAPSQLALAAPAAGSAAAPAAPTPANFAVLLTTDRGATPSYRVGDQLSLKMSINKAGFAACFYEDATQHTARIFPNRFHANSMLQGNFQVPLPTGGFKIKFDRAGRERVVCLASEKDLITPSVFAGAQDLMPLPARSLDDVIGQFQRINPEMSRSQVVITVQ